MRLRLLVDVDVERPVREGDRLRQGLRAGARGGRARALAAAAGSEQARQGEGASGDRRAAQEVGTGQAGCITSRLLDVDDESAVRAPPEGEPVARVDPVRARAVVLDIDGDSAGGRLDDVLRRDADVRALGDDARRARSPRRRRGGASRAGCRSAPCPRGRRAPRAAPVPRCRPRDGRGRPDTVTRRAGSRRRGSRRRTRCAAARTARSAFPAARCGRRP